MQQKNILFYLMPFLLLLACSHKHQPDVVPSADTFVSYKNIVYGTDTVEQAMDVYLPANRDIQHTPVVILIHGGSWVTGDKNDFTGLGLDTFFTSKGCALVNMNYRLYSSYSNVAPLEMQDIGMVMDYIKQKSAQWKINPGRICFFGKSVGSQLALLYTYKYNQDGRIKAVIDGFGPTDLVDSSITGDSLIDGNVGAMIGGPYATNKQAWHDYSPIFYMTGAVPTVIFQGTLDAIVNPVQSLMLQDSLQNRSVPNLFFSWVGEPHGWHQDKWLECRDQTWAFVKQYL